MVDKTTGHSPACHYYNEGFIFLQVFFYKNLTKFIGCFSFGYILFTGRRIYQYLVHKRFSGWGQTKEKKVFLCFFFFLCGAKKKPAEWAGFLPYNINGAQGVRRGVCRCRERRRGADRPDRREGRFGKYPHGRRERRIDPRGGILKGQTAPDPSRRAFVPHRS